MEHEVYEWFFRAEETHWWFRARRRILHSILNELPADDRMQIADIGCGTGGMLETLSRFGEVTPVDQAPEAKDYCTRRGFPGVLTPAEWGSQDSRYNLITAFDMVEHVEDDVSLLADLGSRLLPGGRLLVTVPAYPWLWSAFDEMNHHKRRYTKQHLTRSLKEAGFELERITHFNTFLFAPMALARLMEKATGGNGAADPESILARWFRITPLNGMLESVFAAERHVVRKGAFPFGSSILAIAKRGASWDS